MAQKTLRWTSDRLPLIRIRSSATPRALTAIAAIACALTAACDPCSGFTGCIDTARLTIMGRVLDETTGKPASGTRVDFIRTGGAPLNADSTRAVTDDNGNFVITIGAPGPGEVTGEMAVRSAPGAAQAFGYRVYDQRFRALGEYGEANVLPVWSTKPSLPDIAQLTSSYYPPGVLVFVRVEFRRTGGVRLVGSDTFQTTSGQTGVFPLFDRQVSPTDAGDVIGDLFVDVQGFTLRNFRVRATPEFRRNANVRLVDVTGP